MVKKRFPYDYNVFNRIRYDMPDPVKHFAGSGKKLCRIRQNIMPDPV